MDILTVSNSLNEGEISPRELVKHCLDNINNHNSTYNAFITVCDEEAITEAAIAEGEIMKGKKKGPFHGIPVAIKDVIYTEGIRTTMGSKLFEHFIPDYNATVVQKLKDAGAIMIGKTHTHEFAFGPTGDRSFFGPCYNPHNQAKITGGSSSGSAAAVALDMAMAALGTDTGGSVRIPASACGIVGMKPTFGLISKYGIFSTAYTLDHPGIMTKSTRDNALLLNLLASQDLKDPFSIKMAKKDYTSLLGDNIVNKVIGIPSCYFKNIDKEVGKALEKVVQVYEEQGALIKKVKLPGIQEIAESQAITIQAEAYAVHENYMQEHRSDYDCEVYERLLASKNIQCSQYIHAQQKRKELIDQFNTSFDEVDVLLTPTLPILPTDIDQREVVIGDHSESVRHALLRFTSPTNYTGNPAISVPCGFSANGLPMGFQLIGKHGEEALLYQMAFSYENK